MFTGIIESTGKVTNIQKDKGNVHFTLEVPFIDELTIDQSVAHNGVCLTVVEKTDRTYTVTAIQETLDKTNLGDLNPGDEVNLERCMLMGGRLDGHIVQGHVDETATCTGVKEADGSWYFSFEYDANSKNVNIEKGSITINGVSLTVVNAGDNTFSVAIIPYTYEHTNFKHFKVGTRVNLEFDVIGKYVEKLMNRS